jgi:lipid II:glycine glycyltransferase (peptidoglycan interpeptide bridge formation enzyme)
MLSSAKEKGLQKAAPDLILWTSMKDYQQGGYKLFNFGGLSERELNGEPLEKSGLFHFKKRFSTDEYLCFKGNLVLRPNAGKIYNFLRKIKSKLSV